MIHMVNNNGPMHVTDSPGQPVRQLIRSSRSVEPRPYHAHMNCRILFANESKKIVGW